MWFTVNFLSRSLLKKNKKILFKYKSIFLIAKFDKNYLSDLNGFSIINPRLIFLQSNLALLLVAAGHSQEFRIGKFTAGAIVKHTIPFKFSSFTNETVK